MDRCGFASRGAYQDWANDLPSDVLALVVKKMDARDCKSTLLSCRSWYEVVSMHLEILRPRLLQHHTLDAFPAALTLDLGACNLRPGDLERLQGRERLRNLTLTSEQASSASQALAGCIGLSELCIIGDADKSIVAAVATLSRLGRLTITDWTSFQPSSAAAMLDSLSGLTGLSLDRVSIERYSPDRALLLPCQALVPALPNLQDLDLGRLADTSERSIQALGDLSRLTSFGLGGSPEGLGFLALGRLTSLVRLRILAGCPSFRHRGITAGDVAQLANLENLEELAIRGCDWTDEKNSLCSLSALTALTTLDISYAAKGSKITAQVLGSFPLAQLRELSMRNSRCTAEALSILAHAPHLRVLDISSCCPHSCPSFLQVLPALPELRDLKMDDFGGSEPCDVFQGLRNLTSLEWGSSGSGGHWFACGIELDDEPRVQNLLRRCPSLTSLQRLCIPQQCLGPDAGDTLSRLATLIQLTELDLRGTFCPQGQKYDSLLGPLSALVKLQTLDLSHTEVGSQALQVVGKLKALTSLGLSGVAVGDANLTPLQSLPRLRCLFLNDQPHGQLTDEGLVLLAGVVGLTSLSMRNNSCISGQGVGSLSRLDSLAFLDLRGCLGMHPQAAMKSFQGYPCLGEVLLGDVSDACVILQPGVPVSHLNDLRSSLPYLRNIALSGEVLTGRGACAWANLQFKAYSAAVELNRIYTCLVESIEESQKGTQGSVTWAFMARLMSGHRTPASSLRRSRNFTFPSLSLQHFE